MKTIKNKILISTRVCCKNPAPPTKRQECQFYVLPIASVFRKKSPRTLQQNKNQHCFRGIWYSTQRETKVDIDSANNNMVATEEREKNHKFPSEVFFILHSLLIFNKKPVSSCVGQHQNQFISLVAVNPFGCEKWFWFKN